MKGTEKTELFSEGHREGTEGNAHKAEWEIPIKYEESFFSDAGQMLDQGPERLWEVSLQVLRIRTDKP